MKDILEVINNLRARLWNQYGNPLSSYKKTQDDVHMTYYVGKLMEELGYKYISPSRINGEKEDRVYYSESAIHDAFLAGQVLARKANDQLRREIRQELKAELMNELENL